MMTKLVVISAMMICLVWTTAQCAPQWFHFDTPRTGSKWPPYENADKGYWQVQAEKLESNKVKKAANFPPSLLTSSSAQIVNKDDSVKKAATSFLKKTEK